MDVKINESKYFHEKNDNCFLNVYFKLLILLSIFFFFILKSNNNILKQLDFSQKEILIRLENQILWNLKYNVSDKIMLLRIITNNKKQNYQGIENCLLKDSDSQHCIYHLIAPKHVIGKERILIGEKKDGCYVLLNDFENIKIAYSFGVGPFIQFDRVLAEKGIDVYMYDHTINSLPYNHAKFHWKKIGITGKNKSNNFLKSLEELIIENGHSSEDNMILKMDIEYNEWESLIDVSEKMLSQFKYILLELHFNDEKESNNTLLYYNVLKNIYKTHQCFYIRCADRYNIANFGNNRICKFLEISYIIRKDYKFAKDLTIYPIKEFDFADIRPNIEEMNINILKFFDDIF